MKYYSHSLEYSMLYVDYYSKYWRNCSKIRVDYKYGYINKRQYKCRLNFQKRMLKYHLRSLKNEYKKIR